jgi:DNA-binding response OmpR family regulator
MSETEAKDSGWVLPSANTWHATSVQTSGSPTPGLKEAASKSSSKVSVLIVEDDWAARKAITLILKRQGFAVSEASTVEDAFRGLRQQHHPEWVLLDLMLPDGNGMDVLRQVRSEGICCKVCIITGCGPELVREAHHAGAEHVFTKPLDVERLIKVLTA